VLEEVLSPGMNFYGDSMGTNQLTRSQAFLQQSLLLNMFSRAVVIHAAAVP